VNKPPLPINFYFFSSLVFILLWLASPHVNASNDFPLSPYEAQYNIQWHGLKAGTSVHTLKQNPDQTYTVESKTIPRFKWVPLHFVERSQFMWNNQEIKPLHYFYDLKEARKHKKGAVEFDWKNNRVYNKIGQEPWEQKITKGIQDKLTHALKLRTQLMQHTNKPLKFIVAEDDEVKPYIFNVIAHERIKTELGWLDSVKISHTSRSNKTYTMWLAKNFEYAPIRVEQAKDNSVFAEGEIISYKKL
jgi:hypothetical protein